MMNYDPKIIRISQGIAEAEGFYEPNSLPAWIHNPGDLELGDRGWGVQAGKTVFPDDETGWDWLYGEATLMLAGKQSPHHSKFIHPSMTFLEAAEIYTGEDNAPAWAKTVSEFCGMEPTNTLQDFLNAN